MNEMIERVARVLALQAMKKLASGHGEAAGHTQWVLDRPAKTAEWVDGTWNGYRADAVAAIEAMREPTEAMKEAASRDAAQAHYETHPSTAGWLYSTMIDEALKT